MSELFGILSQALNPNEKVNEPKPTGRVFRVLGKVEEPEYYVEIYQVHGSRATCISLDENMERVWDYERWDYEKGLYNLHSLDLRKDFNQ